MTAASLEQVLDGLRADGALTAEQNGQATAMIARLRDVQPWYVRTMAGLGAWLASLLLIGFVAGFGLALGGSALVGLALIVAAVWVRRRRDAGNNDFIVQCTLATSLAGQALFGWGIADLLPGEQLKSGCFIVAAVSAGLFFVFPDRVHRVLMLLFVTAAVVTLLYMFKLAALIPVVGPLVVAALFVVNERRASLVAAGHGALVRPLMNGLMLSAFGCLLLSTIYVTPELETGFRFYPRPWLSTLLLGVLFLAVCRTAWSPLLEDAGTLGTAIVHALLLVVIAAAWAAPGLLLALVVVVLGASTGHRGMAAAGTGFLAVFVAAWFYGIEVSMLTKSLTLVGSGIAILAGRWCLMRMLDTGQHG